MKKLFSVIAIASMVLLSVNAHSRLGVNRLGLNGLTLNGVDQTQTLNLRSLAQVPLVKAD